MLTFSFSSSSLLLPPGSVISNTAVMTAAGWRNISFFTPDEHPGQPFHLAREHGSELSHVQLLGGQGLLDNLAGKLVLLHLQNDGRTKNNCVAFRVAGISGVVPDTSTEDASLSYPTPDYLSIVLYSFLLLMVYMVATIACMWLKRKKGKETLDDGIIRVKTEKNKENKEFEELKVYNSKLFITSKVNMKRQDQEHEEQPESNDLWKTFLEALDYEHGQLRRQSSLSHQLNSLSSQNHLISGNTFHRCINQHVHSDEREDFYNEVISVDDTDNSDTESDDSDKVDYTVRLELKS